ncbi:Rhs element Vgr protein [Massilia agilis]|uniref:Rhs element Vgr protein n=1 Tax=Massilia agilis TaxID=1811226 RepID=A0ABT2D7P0_9BURK|nr:Rhs element Vgr protein [Massilia agilis]MCS0807337.1 Rhs element Vgr protein [Massilia agilis]
MIRLYRSRPLTPAEMVMAALVFGKSIDYQRVRIHARRYLPLVQPKNCCMTPNGSMYFHRSCFLPDYTRGDPPAVHWFIHEMAHVWQHQLGYAVRLRGAVRVGLSYDYDLAPGKAFADFNMEAQGELLADYFMLKHMGRPETLSQQRYRDSLPLYQEVLADFLADPASVGNLPRDSGRCLLHLKRLTRSADYWPRSSRN